MEWFLEIYALLHGDSEFPLSKSASTQCHLTPTLLLSYGLTGCAIPGRGVLP